jgi:hypothetical protein
MLTLVVMVMVTVAVERKWSHHKSNVVAWAGEVCCQDQSIQNDQQQSSDRLSSPLLRHLLPLPLQMILEYEVEEVEDHNQETLHIAEWLVILHQADQLVWVVVSPLVCEVKAEQLGLSMV